MTPTKDNIPDSEKTTAEWDALPDVVVLNVSMVTMLVCVTDGTIKKEIERVANLEHPTGISSSWSVDDEVEPQPCKDGRPDATHYVLSC